MKALKALILLLILAFPLAAQAQELRILGKNQALGSYEEKRLRKIPPPVEPEIPEVKFMMIEPALSTQERIDRLVQGITIDIPPVYDHYGYELRRYMAHIAGPDVLGDPERIKQELQNVARAKIILNFWQEELNKEIYEIDKVVKSSVNDSYYLTTPLKYNRGIVSAFLVECKSWLDNNEEMLKFLLLREDMYVLDYPIITFDENEDRDRFGSLYEARAKAHEIMMKYAPFSVMIY